MILFDSFLDESIEKIKGKNVKIRFIGDFSSLIKNIQDKINRLSLLSENNKV